MAKYEVTITEIFHHTLTVEAETESDAEKAALAKTKWQLQSFGRAEAGDLTVYSLDYQDADGTTIGVMK